MSKKALYEAEELINEMAQIWDTLKDIFEELGWEEYDKRTIGASLDIALGRGEWLRSDPSLYDLLAKLEEKMDED